jgi:hypothetical protein
LTPITSSRTYAFTIEKLEERIKPFVCINNVHITCKETKRKKLSPRETIILVSLNEKIVIFLKRKRSGGFLGVLMRFI